MVVRTAVAALAAALVASSPTRAEEELFGITVLSSSGRTVAAELADLDGDDRSDLLLARFEGIPPQDRRSLRIHFQRGEGGFDEAPDLVTPLPPATVAFEPADVLPDPGVEILILERGGVRILSFSGRQVRERMLPLPGAVTAGPSPDERGLSRLSLASFAFGEEPVLVVPGLGEAFLLSPSGDPLSRLDVGGRANYFVQPQGLVYAESDIQLFYDVPRLSIGDIDGDGRADILSSSRHELRVFLQRPDRSFPSSPDRQLLLERVSMGDHMRGSGAVRAAARDVDGDGQVDLMISATTGGLTDAESTTWLHLNRAGRWDLDAPDLLLRTEKAVGADQLLDFDGDGHLELLQARVPVTVLELVEIFLTRSLDARMAMYRLSQNGVGDGLPKPVFERKLGLPINFDTGRLRGFIPTFEYDLNADGYLDFLHSTDGSALEVYLGGPTSRYRKRAIRQELPVAGVLRSGDLDADGLVDFVLCNPREPDSPVRLLHNRGVLGGARTRVEKR